MNHFLQAKAVLECKAIVCLDSIGIKHSFNAFHKPHLMSHVCIKQKRFDAPPEILYAHQMPRHCTVATELFERAIALEKKAEAGYFEYGRYLDSLMRDARQRQAAKAVGGRGASSAPDRLGGRARCGRSPASAY